jgi:CARDB protein
MFKENRRLLALIIAILGVIAITTSCKDNDTDSTKIKTGQLTVRLVWEGVAGSSIAETLNRTLNSMPSTVVTVRFSVSASDMSEMQQDFTASTGSGTINSIPIGSDRTLTVYGLDSDGTTLYEGTKSGIEVVAGQATGAGTIEMVSATDPDLQVVSITVPTDVFEAQTYTEGATVVIKNAGSKISQAFNLHICARYNDSDVYSGYLIDCSNHSSSTSWSSQGGQKIGETTITTIESGEEKTLKIDLEFPDNATISASNYVGIWVDPENTIEEADENNNKGGYNSSTQEYNLGDALKLIHIHENEPNIEPTIFSPNSSYSFGDTSTISVSIKNSGHPNISNAFKVAICARYNDSDVYDGYTIDCSNHSSSTSWSSQGGQRIGETSVVGLQADETKELSIPITIPTGGTSGTHYIGVWVDYENTIDEMETEADGDENYNKGGWTSTGYGVGDFLKVVTIN